MIELRVQSLSKQYGSKSVLSNLSFRSEKRTLAIAGSNGSGKSTLLLCLAGLLKPSSGSFHWNSGVNSIPPDTLKNHLGYLAPYIELYEELTVSENLSFLAKVRSLPVESVETALERAEAITFIDQSYGSLSTGQRQRIKFAAALLHTPAVLMLDEPGSNLDLSGTKTLENIVRQQSDMGGLVIIASNQEYELKLCEQIIDLNNQ